MESKENQSGIEGERRTEVESKEKGEPKWNRRRKENRSGIEPRPFAYQPSALPLSQTGSQGQRLRL